jgi:hypothetical protein
MNEDRSPMSPEEPKPLKMRGAWILSLVLLVPASISTAVAVLEATSWPSLLGWLGLMATLIAVVTFVAALIQRDLYDVREKSRLAKQATLHTARKTKTIRHSPAPFRTRLATFLQVPEESVFSPRPRPVSSMPFWSSMPLSPRPIVMKSVEFIRAVLERIHAAVRG